MAKRINNRFTILGIVIGILFWFIDGFLDGIFFSEHNSVFLSTFKPEPVEIYIRLLVFTLFLFYGIYTGHVRQILLDTNNELINQQILLKEEIQKRKFTEKKLKKISIEDPLTGIFNQRKIVSDLNHMLNLYERYNKSFSLIICDLDKFKKVNDKLGHLSGDRCLIEFTKITRNNIRKSDIFARYGGDEFLILLPYTSRKEAENVGIKILNEINKKLSISKYSITSSLGVTSVFKDDTIESIIARADRALYMAKSEGGNRIFSL